MSNLISINMAWNSICWPLVIKRVRRVQRRIFKAKKLGLKSKVHWLQKLLINSIDAKLLAVYQVTMKSRATSSLLRSKPKAKIRAESPEQIKLSCCVGSGSGSGSSSGSGSGEGVKKKSFCCK